MRFVQITVVAMALLIVSARPAAAGPPYHCNQANMHPTTLLVGQVGQPYLDTISITPANAYFYHQWSMTPAFVAGGLTLVPNPINTNNDATIQGTPTMPGTFQVIVEGGGTYVYGTICRVQKTYTLVVTP